MSFQVGDLLIPKDKSRSEVGFILKENTSKLMYEKKYYVWWIHGKRSTYVWISLSQIRRNIRDFNWRHIASKCNQKEHKG